VTLEHDHFESSVLQIDLLDESPIVKSDSMSSVYVLLFDHK